MNQVVLPSYSSFDLDVPTLELNHLEVDYKVTELGCQLKFIQEGHLGCFSEGCDHLGNELLLSKAVKPR